MNESRNKGQFDASVDALTEGETLLVRLGYNVRAARTAKRMPRRVLSDLSGVSPRYLAQLESGQGNISIALLHRVAEALDRNLLELLGDKLSEEQMRLVDLYRSADARTRSGVMHRLEQAAPGPDRAQRICLIGLRGAGKSTLGRMASEALNVPFVELNKDIELKVGMPIAEIMALYGADGYRQLEAEAVRRVAARHNRMILAASGGIVSESDTYSTVLSRFHTIWIKANAEEHMRRVRAQGDLRPMQGQTEAMTQLRTLLDGRREDYSRAEATLDTVGKSPEASLEELLALIGGRRLLAA